MRTMKALSRDADLRTVLVALSQCEDFAEYTVRRAGELKCCAFELLLNWNMYKNKQKFQNFAYIKPKLDSNFQKVK